MRPSSAGPLDRPGYLEGRVAVVGDLSEERAHLVLGPASTCRVEPSGGEADGSVANWDAREIELDELRRVGVELLAHRTRPWTAMFHVPGANGLPMVPAGSATCGTPMMLSTTEIRSTRLGTFWPGRRAGI